MTLELRAGAPVPAIKKLQYIKVTNPDNPKEFAYVEKNLYDHLAKEASQGMNSFFGSLWNGVKGAVGGFVTGGPLGAVAGAVAGFTSPTKLPNPQVAISSAANGASTISITQPTSAPVPAVVQPKPGMNPDDGKKDNTLLYVGLGAAALLLLRKK